MESDLIESQKKLYGIDLEKTGKESQERMLARGGLKLRSRLKAV